MNSAETGFDLMQYLASFGLGVVVMAIMLTVMFRYFTRQIKAKDKMISTQIGEIMGLVKTVTEVATMWEKVADKLVEEDRALHKAILDKLNKFGCKYRRPAAPH